MSKDKETLLVIDGHSMAFRSFYGIKPDNFRLESGQYTNAVYGFFSSLLSLIDIEHPTYLAVAFDYSKNTFRKDEYPEYKEGRKPTPEEFKGQIQLIQDLLDSMNIKWFWTEKYEADDIVATISQLAVDSGKKAVVFSGDKDVLQLVSSDVTVRYPKNGRRTPIAYTPSKVERDFGVPANVYPDLAALTGEKADNLPSVPGLGSKTALSLIQKYGSLENLFKNLHELSGRYTRNLPDYVDIVKRNRHLNELVRKVPLPIESVEDLKIIGMDKEKTIKFLDHIKSNRLKMKILDAYPECGFDSVASIEIQKQNCTTAEELIKYFENNESNQYSITLIGDKTNKPFVMCNMVLFISNDKSCIKVDLQPDKNKFAYLKAFFADEKICKVFFDFKSILHALKPLGFNNFNNVDDVLLQAYLLDPDKTEYLIEDIIHTYLGYNLKNSGETESALFDLESNLAYFEITNCLLKLSNILKNILKERELLDIYKNIEIPIADILFEMEDTGISLDKQRLYELEKEFANSVQMAERIAYEAIGNKEINLSSPKQLQKVLFEDLKMQPTKKTKNGNYTTNAEALKDLYIQTGHEFLGAVIEHRNSIKLLQIVKGIIKQDFGDNKVHTSFLQTTAATGRLSSANPNLQNIPARTTDGSKIREVFVKSDGYEGLMTADYSQIEMRIMAHLCGDETLINAFKRGDDLHKVAASIVYGVPVEDVTSLQRSHIKAVTYGLVYGLSPYGLSRQLSISVGHAHKLMDKYFQQFGRVREFLNEQVEIATKRGYTQTIFGRKRYMADLDSSNYNRREAARRAALNAPIQGSAADIIKVAMIKVVSRMKEEGLKSNLLLQVHDELIFDVYLGERAELEKIVKDCMTSAIALDVPLEVGIGFGDNWRYAAH